MVPAPPPDALAFPEPPPLVLLANPDAWFRDSVETVLAQEGFRILTADSGPRTLELARRHRPDAVILDLAFQPQWPDAYVVCRALREGDEPILSPAVPIVLTTPGPALRAHQLEALRQGAWELRGDPLDVEDLALRLRAYVRAKREADRVALVDAAGGGDLYNAAGLSRRAEELIALARRQRIPIACVIFLPPAAEEFGPALRRAGRLSDAIGRTGHLEFAVFAPATDASGAAGLVARIRKAVGNGDLRAGISAAEAVPGLTPADLLKRARMTLE